MKNVSEKKELEAIYNHYYNRAIAQKKKFKRFLMIISVFILSFVLSLVVNSFDIKDIGWFLSFVLSSIVCFGLFAIVFYYLFPGIKNWVSKDIDQEEIKDNILIWIKNDNKYLSEKIESLKTERAETEKILIKRKKLLTIVSNLGV